MGEREKIGETAEPSVSKTTVLEGYYASGDCECFCFDKWDGPDVYWEVFPDSGDLMADTDAIIRAQSANRVYPDDLLPEGAKFGRWEITVAFTPMTAPQSSPAPAFYGGIPGGGV